MNAFKTDVKRALTSWGFMVGIAGLAVAAFFGAFNDMLPVFQGKMPDGLQEGFTVQLVFTALSSDVVLLVLPVLCALPFTTAFLEDYKSRYIREYIPRSGKRQYTNAKVLTTVLSGGLTLFLGVMLVLSVFAMLFLPMEVPAETPELSFYEEQMLRQQMEDTASVTAQQNFAELMTRAFVFFLSGALWSLVGALLACVTQSRYMAYASPFVLYYVLVILCERYFAGVYVINPQEWLAPQNEWVGGTWGVALLVGEIAAITAFAYAYCIRRRLEDA